MKSVLNFFPAPWAQHYNSEFLFFGSTLIPPLSESTHSHSGSPFKHFNLLWEYHTFFQGHPLLTERFFTSCRTVINGNLQVVLPFQEAQLICSLKKTNVDISLHLSRVWNTEICCNDFFCPLSEIFCNTYTYSLDFKKVRQTHPLTRLKKKVQSKSTA